MAASVNPRLSGTPEIFRGAAIVQFSNGAGTAASTVIRPSSGTYATLGAFTKIKMDVALRDTDNCVNVDNSTVNITAITVGNPTVVTLASNPWGLITGDLMDIELLTGVDAAFLNGQTFAISAVSGLDFSLDVNSTGKTITRDAGTTAGDGDYSSIIVPAWARYVKVKGHITYPDQNILAGKCRIHLWRAVTAATLTDAGSDNQAYGAAPGSNYIGKGHRPTPEAHYHNAIYYPTDAGSDYFSLGADTPWIPVMATGEKWTLYGWQDTGADVTSDIAAENWLTVEFRT